MAGVMSIIVNVFTHPPSQIGRTMNRIKNMPLPDFYKMADGVAYILRGACTVRRDGNTVRCTSYETVIATYNIDNNTLVVDKHINNYSPTTTRHYSEFRNLIARVEGDCPAPDTAPYKHTPHGYIYGW